jgi:hypothetical protein
MVRQSIKPDLYQAPPPLSNRGRQLPFTTTKTRACGTAAGPSGNDAQSTGWFNDGWAAD